MKAELKRIEDAICITLSARMLLDDRKAWAKGAYARDANGEGINPANDGAVSFCVIGAVMAVTSDINETAYSVARNTLECCMGDSIASYNDAPGRTHANILRVFDQAAEKLIQQL